MIISRKGNACLLSTKNTKVKVEENSSITIESDTKTYLDWPGEYEAGGITVRAFEEGEGLAFLVYFDGLSLFFPAAAPLKSAEEDLKETGDIELLFISPESENWNSKDWKKFIEEIEPRIVVFGESGEKAALLRKELGIEMIETVDKLDISEKNLPAENIRFLQLISTN